MITTELGGARVAAFYLTQQGGTLPSGGGRADEEFGKILLAAIITNCIIVGLFAGYIFIDDAIEKKRHLSSPEHNKLTQRVSDLVLNSVHHTGVKPADQIDIKNITITPQQVQQAQRDSAHYATQITKFVRNNVDDYIIRNTKHQIYYRVYINPFCVICGKWLCPNEAHPTVHIHALIKDKKLEALKKKYDLAVQQLEVQRRYNRLHKTK